MSNCVANYATEMLLVCTDFVMKNRNPFKPAKIIFGCGSGGCQK